MKQSVSPSSSHSAADLFFWAIVLSLLLSCGSPRTGALSPEARSELDNFAEGYIDIEKKYLKLAEMMASLLEEAAATPSDEAAMGLVQKFASDNDLAIETISIEFDGWQKHVNQDDLMQFVGLLINQPAGKKLRRLIPAFRNRIKYNERWLREYDAMIQKMYFHR
ncbi:MAG: hypothetical protein AAF587_31805 [Bacteroidota bacterium]